MALSGSVPAGIKCQFLVAQYVLAEHILRELQPLQASASYITDQMEKIITGKTYGQDLARCQAYTLC